MTTEQCRVALQCYAAKEKLDQDTIRALSNAGYLEVREVRNLTAAGVTLLPTFITEKGRALLESR